MTRKADGTEPPGGDESVLIWPSGWQRLVIPRRRERPGPAPAVAANVVAAYENAKQADAAKGKALSEFMAWSLHDGQKLTQALNYAPLPDELVVTLYELMQLFLEQYEERYQYRIQRFYYERDREQRELRAQMIFDEAQRSLPLEDDKPF